MTGKLKALGLAFVAVFAMSAVAASAAQAVEFHSEAANTSLSGGQTTQHRFRTDTGTVICNTATFSGTAANATESDLTITPAYSECEFEGLFTVTVNTNGCKYTFTEPEASGTDYQGTVDITGCNATTPFIQVGSLATCRVRVREQTGVALITYQNQGAGTNRDVLVTSKVANLNYEEEGLFCANSGQKTTKGEYTGTTTVKGEAGGAQVGVWIE